ncbi:zinc finger, LSD1 subclass family protein, putative (macronuclear) [Tetrahymena thermophila SB210]|uniref:Zinc finger, LSD1 subclass family protein, putative n=1 Tax=Tetrahymena thermophila (strain SB210) TaxID=312017 RepID=Q22E35_TETTS|nr:zinc finger, LSD1 subclass family protein, putative [Tetrahymena thermophila SB210]EAR83579.2 zinc finger, LSD1 subclass family protein, putative [Tetrahymena thermophila SB210]|eukprot:XP_001031242.2 zinc finger, LSD1 subclass family protein, putative [Tetrahymena thermophila SB210]
MICNQKDIEFNQANLGEYQLAYQATATTFSLKNLPPHFQVNVRIDYYLIMTWDNESLSVYGGSQKKLFYRIQYDYGNSSIKLQRLCYGDQYINYFYRTEYTLDDANSDFSISFQTNCKLFQINGCESTSNESFAIGQVQVFVNECHFSCLSCSGPLQNQCKLCYNNINPTNGICPQCQGANNIFDNGTCVSKCPSGKVNKNQVCVLQDQFCQSFQQNGYSCQQCLPNYYLWNGKCMTVCPLFYGNTNNICQDQIRSLPSNFLTKTTIFLLIQINLKQMDLLHLKDYKNLDFHPFIFNSQDFLQ